MRHCVVFVILVCLCGLTGCGALDATIRSKTFQPGPTEIYTNAVTGFCFPPTVDTFNRERVTVFNRQGNDIGVGYNQPGYRMALTVFVYPIPADGPDSTFDAHFKRCEQTILVQHSDVQLVTNEDIQIWPGNVRHDGRRAVFNYMQANGSVNQAVRSELYLFARGKQFVLYRMTYPESMEGGAEPAIKFFLEDFAWPQDKSGNTGN